MPIPILPNQVSLFPHRVYVFPISRSQMHFISRKKACQGCIAMLVRVENQVEATDQIPTHISAWTRLVLVNLGASITRTSSTRTHYICWNRIHMPRLVIGNILGINSACAAAEIFGIWPGIQLLPYARYQLYDRLYCFPLVMGRIWWVSIPRNRR